MYRTLAIIVILFATLAAVRAQTAVEDGIRLALWNESVRVTVPFDSTAALETRIVFEIVAPDDTVAARAEMPISLAPGRQTAEFEFAVGPKIASDPALIWYRLRYRVGDGPAATVSFSRVMPEIFELRSLTNWATGEDVYRVTVQAAKPGGGDPVDGVRVSAELMIEGNETPLVSEAVTAADGTVLLEFRLPRVGSDDDVTLRVRGIKGAYSTDLAVDVRVIADRGGIIVTDKPIYQPGQTVNARFYLYDQRRRPVGGTPVSFRFRNPKDDDVQTAAATTSAFGIAAVSWKIPDGAAFGDYQLNVLDEEGDFIGFERFRVTRYELPSFAVDAGPDRKFYLPGTGPARVSVETKYLFGKPVPGALLRLAPLGGERDLFPETTAEADDRGKHEFAIDLGKAFEKLRPDDGRAFRDFTLAVYATDPTTLRTESRRFDLRLTSAPIHVYLVGDTDDQSSRSPLEFFVSTFFADGTPAECEVGVYEEIDTDLDGEPVAPETGRMLSKTRTNRYGAGRIRLPYEPAKDSGEMHVRIVATNPKGTGTLGKTISADDKPSLGVRTDKVVYRPGEPVRVSIGSSERGGTVFVDIARGQRVVAAERVALVGGIAEVVVPFNNEFRRGLTVAAYFPDAIGSTGVAKTAIIYPEKPALTIAADTDREEFRPGDEVRVRLRSTDAVRSPAAASLGVLVLDKAVEDRARSESEFDSNGGFLNRTFTGPFANLLGRAPVFGELTANDILEADLSKPVPADFELAVAIALGESYYEPQLTRSGRFREDAERVFGAWFRERMKPVEAAVDRAARDRNLFPATNGDLQEVLRLANIDPGTLRDPWGEPLSAEFSAEREYRRIELWSAGPDKMPGTADDLSVFESSWRYFRPVGVVIDEAVLDYTSRTDDFITDYGRLRAEMLKRRIDPDKLLDPWGNPYRFSFTVDRTNFLIEVRSDGPDRRTPNDDFTVWTNRSDYFSVQRAMLARGFAERTAKTKSFPANEDELRRVLAAIGFDLGKDVFGRPYYISRKQAPRLTSVYRISKGRKAVRQTVVSFAVRSAGADGVQGNFDDFELAAFSGAVAAQEIDLSAARISNSWGRTESGALAGTVFDPVGAVIPGATVSIENAGKTVRRTAATDANGNFLIPDLAPDTYTLEIESPGFKRLIIQNLSVEKGDAVTIDLMLEVGDVSTTVEVSSGGELFLNTSQSQISQSVTVGDVRAGAGSIAPSFTPRVRRDFVETLFWAPEVLTAQKGEATVAFPMADSLTTWNLYVIGNDAEGNFAAAKKQIRSFQPLFADLEPPRILTEGDEISLPVPVRNYIGREQRVSVTIDPNPWSRALRGSSRTLSVPAGGSRNASFEIRAERPVVDGIQKVSAVADGIGDAVEKPVTVRPNGREIVAAQADLFSGSKTFDVSFPADSFPATRSAVVRVYPNALSHVAESVEALLKRPYGCGEQTTSSTYPNLLILRIERDLKAGIEPGLRNRAAGYLDEGYRRLLNYQTTGGFGYWNGSEANIPLTAYVLRFLHDAKDFIEVDADRIERAEEWLLSKQSDEGRWGSSAETAYVARSLALTGGRDSVKRERISKALRSLAGEKSDAWVLANMALAAFDLGEKELAETWVSKLAELAVSDRSGLGWNTGSTPFFGWGSAARTETTALAVRALQRSGQDRGGLASSGLVTLLRGKDRFGTWHSTQTTVNVLEALVGSVSDGPAASVGPVRIVVNGRTAAEIPAAGKTVAKPTETDISRFLDRPVNSLEVAGGSGPMMAQIVSTHYSDWKSLTPDDRYFDFAVEFDRTAAKPGELITARARIGAKRGTGGMAVAEIGLPPGAEIDRASLEKARSSGAFSRYEFRPDRLIVYFWIRTDLSFSFGFRPRFAMKAQTAPSVVYDFYNEESRRELAPARFEIK